MAEAVRVQCDNCRSTIKAPEKYHGKTVKCPKCANRLSIPFPEEEAAFLDDDAFDEEDYEDYEAAGEDYDDFDKAFGQAPAVRRRRQGLSDVDSGRASRPRSQRSKSGGDGGLFSTSGGVIGGILMMTIAAVWFIAGWMNGTIFFYPPVLFIIGVVAFFKGLAGN